MSSQAEIRVLSLPDSAVRRPPSSGNCAICLHSIKNKALAASCFHAFCFQCLKRWSIEKPECPMCKISFRSIYYNLRTDTDYNEYIVGQSTGGSSAEPRTSNSSVEESHTSVVTSGPPLLPNYPTPAGSNRNLSGLAAVRGLIAASASLSHIFELFSTPFTSDTYNIRHVRRVEREDVYRYMLMSLPPECGIRDRDYTVAFYSQNRKAEEPRLSAWLVRDLTAIRVLIPSISVMGEVKEALRQLLRTEIYSNSFYHAMRPHTKGYTGKFAHEFYLFAKSQYHVSDYIAATAYIVLHSLPVETILIPRHGSGRTTPRRDLTATDNDNARVVSPRRDSHRYPELNTNNQSRSEHNKNSATRIGGFPSSLARPLNNHGTEVPPASSEDHPANTGRMNLIPTLAINTNFEGANAASSQNAHQSNQDSGDECVIVEPSDVVEIVISDTEEEKDRRNATLPSPLHVQTSSSRAFTPVLESNLSRQRNCSSDVRDISLETNRSHERRDYCPAEQSTSRELSNMSVPRAVTSTPGSWSLRSRKKTPCKNDGVCEMPCSSNEGNSSPGLSGSRAKQKRSTPRKKDHSLKCSEKDNVFGMKKHLLTRKKHEDSSHQCHKEQHLFPSGPAGNLRSRKRRLNICSGAVKKRKEEDIPDIVSCSKGRGMNSKTKTKKGRFVSPSRSRSMNSKTMTKTSRFVSSSRGRSMNL